jgi:hypothetical protein
LNASNHPDHHITEKRGFKKKNSVEILFFLFGCLEFAFNGGILRIFHARLDRVDGGPRKNQIIYKLRAARAAPPSAI